jgi:hypothetical protein
MVTRADTAENLRARDVELAQYVSRLGMFDMLQSEMRPPSSTVKWSTPAGPSSTMGISSSPYSSVTSNSP